MNVKQLKYLLEEVPDEYLIGFTFPCERYGSGYSDYINFDDDFGECDVRIVLCDMDMTATLHFEKVVKKVPSKGFSVSDGVSDTIVKSKKNHLKRIK